MRDLGDHAASFLRVHALGHAVKFAQTEGLEGLAHLHRAADATAHLANANLLRLRLRVCLLRAHTSAPSTTGSSLPRRALYCSLVRSCLRASNVAFTTLCGLAVPSDL